MRKDKIIRITIDLPMSFPEDWDNEMRVLCEVMKWLLV